METIHDKIRNYEAEKEQLTVFGDLDMFDTLQQIYENYYVEDISNLAKALNINVNIDEDTDDIFQAVIDLEHEIDLKLAKYYKSIDEELSLMMDLLRESDLPDTMPNEVTKILDLEDYRFGINQKLDKIR